MSSNRTALKVTIHFTENSIPGLRRGELTVESKQELLAGILALPCLQDENPDAYHITAVGDKRNELREELRKAITTYFMGGDVGVDMGSSHMQSTPTAQGHEAGNSSEVAK